MENADTRQKFLDASRRITQTESMRTRYCSFGRISNGSDGTAREEFVAITGALSKLKAREETLTPKRQRLAQANCQLDEISNELSETAAEINLLEKMSDELSNLRLEKMNSPPRSQKLVAALSEVIREAGWTALRSYGHTPQDVVDTLKSNDGQRERYRREIEGLATEVSDLKRSLRDGEHNHEKLRLKWESAEKHLSESRKTYVSSLKAWGDERFVAQLELDELDAQLKEALQRGDFVLQTYYELALMFASVEEHYNICQENYYELSMSYQTLESDCAQNQAKLTANTMSLKWAREHIGHQNTTLTQKAAELDTLNSQAVLLSTENQVLIAALDTAKTELSTKSKDLEAVNLRLVEVDTLLAERCADISGLETKLEACDVLLTGKLEELDSLTGQHAKELESVNTKLSSTNSELTNTTSRLNSLKASLDAANSLGQSDGGWCVPEHLEDQ